MHTRIMGLTGLGKILKSAYIHTHTRILLDMTVTFMRMMYIQKGGNYLSLNIRVYVYVRACVCYQATPISTTNKILPLTRTHYIFM